MFTLDLVSKTSQEPYPQQKRHNDDVTKRKSLKQKLYMCVVVNIFCSRYITPLDTLVVNYHFQREIQVRAVGSEFSDPKPET